MSDVVHYDVKDRIARIVFDDGKVNVMSPAKLRAIGSSLDRAERDEAVVILTSGRKGIVSVGFDLKIFARNDSAGRERARGRTPFLAPRGKEEVVEMVKLGAELAL